MTDPVVLRAIIWLLRAVIPLVMGGHAPHTAAHGRALLCECEAALAAATDARG